MKKQKFDLAIIGAGPGGYVAALRAAQLGLKTVCIDKRKSPGGTCLHVGCIPSKALLYTTELYSHVKKIGPQQGVVADSLHVDFIQLMANKEKTVSGLVNGINSQFSAQHVTFIGGEARFVSSHTIEVTTEGEKEEIEADQFLLATGSEPIPLPSLPFDEKRVISSTGALSLPSVPKELVVIGAGVIGVELASVYQRLGSKVTIIEMLDHICPAMDKKVSHSLLRVLQSQGIEFRLSTKIVGSEIDKKTIVLKLESEGKSESLQSSIVLVAIGRRPYSQGLGLDQAGITLTAKGFVSVDSCFRTQQPHIFAIGDLIDGPMLAHRASEEGTCIVNYIAGQSHSINYMTIPNVIYTSPEAAAVGLTEEEALSMGLSIKTGISYFKANPRARCVGDTEGFVKIIMETTSQRLIGMHILGAQASELIAEGMLAIEKCASIPDIAYAPNAHPTLSETIKEAAQEALK